MAGITALVLLWWLTTSAVLWWDAGAIGAAQEQKAELEARVTKCHRGLALTSARLL